MTAMTTGHGMSTCVAGRTGTAARFWAPTGIRPSRDRRILAAILGSAALLVGGCGVGGPAATPGATSPSSASALVAPPRAAAGPAGGTTVYPLTIIDDAGRRVTIPSKPRRIISLTLGTDEILPALVSKPRLVGVTAYASKPSMSFVTGEVGGISAFQVANAAQAVALKPDVVFAASYTQPGVILQLTHAGIPVVEFNTFSSLADIEGHVTTIAAITDDEARGQVLVAAMQHEAAAVKLAVAGLTKPRVVFYSAGYIYGSGTTMDQLIRDAGGINAAAAAGIKNWQQVGPEEIVHLNPDIILTDDAGSGDIVRGPAVQQMLADPALQGVAAVKDRAVWGLSGRADSDVSQYMAWDLQDVASILHPHHVHPYAP